MKKQQIFGDLGNPDALQVLAEGQDLRKSGYRTKQDILKGSRYRKSSTEILMGGFARLKDNSESGISPFDTFLDCLEGMKFKGVLQTVNYMALGGAVKAGMSMALQAGIKEERQLFRAVYILLFFDLYELNYKIEDFDQILSLRDESIADTQFENICKKTFFDLFKVFTDLLKDYFYCVEEETELNYILLAFDGVYDRYQKNNPSGLSTAKVD